MNAAALGTSMHGIASLYGEGSNISSVEMITEIVLQIVIFSIGLYIWNKMVYPEKPQIPDFVDTLERGDFEAHLCGCFSDVELCVLGFVSPLPRLVDTYVTATVTERGDACLVATAIFGSLLCLPTLPITLCLYLPYKRAQVRTRLGGRSSYIIDDVIISSAFFWCHVCQMARDVDMTAGHTTTVICKIRALTEDEIAVGLPRSIRTRGRFSDVTSVARTSRPSRISGVNNV